jgi:hypothetical protein
MNLHVARSKSQDKDLYTPLNSLPTCRLCSSIRLLKNAHLLRFPCLPAGRLILPRVKHGAGLLRRTSEYASFLRNSGDLHLGIFEQPAKKLISSTS